jgi:hypothetical protein
MANRILGYFCQPPISFVLILLATIPQDVAPHLISVYSYFLTKLTYLKRMRDAMILRASGMCSRNSTSIAAGRGGSMLLKVYSITILLLDILSVLVKVIFAVVESIYQTIAGVTEKSVANEIVLVSSYFQ